LINSSVGRGYSSRAARIEGRGRHVISPSADAGLPGSAPLIAPFIRGQAAGPPPDLADWERPLYDQVMSQVPPESAMSPRIDRELADGDELGFGDGAVTVAVPGHTPGSIAVYLLRHRVLFTGDAAARRHNGGVKNGGVICGVFNVDRAQAAASFHRLAGLSVAVACFGHGEPLIRDAT
jgi:glyoxylase-like metal-dependent hydrolase (beta-lactamase superfamily II)